MQENNENLLSAVQPQSWTPGDQSVVDSLDSVLFNFADITWEKMAPLEYLLQSPSSSTCKVQRDPFTGISTENEAVQEDDINLEDLFGFEGSLNPTSKHLAQSQVTPLRSSSISLPVQRGPKAQAVKPSSYPIASDSNSTSNSQGVFRLQTTTSINSIRSEQDSCLRRVMEMPAHKDCSLVSQAIESGPVNHNFQFVKQAVPPNLSFQNSLLRRVMANAHLDIASHEQSLTSKPPQLHRLEQQALANKQTLFDGLLPKPSSLIIQGTHAQAKGSTVLQRSPLCQVLSPDFHPQNNSASQATSLKSLYHSVPQHRPITASSPQLSDVQINSPLIAPAPERYKPAKVSPPSPRQYHAGSIRRQSPIEVYRMNLNSTNDVKAIPTFQNSPAVSLHSNQTSRTKLDDLFRNQLLANSQTPPLSDISLDKKVWDVEQLKSSGNRNIQIISSHVRQSISEIKPAGNKSSLLQQLLTEPE